MNYFFCKFFYFWCFISVPAAADDNDDYVNVNLFTIMNVKSAKTKRKK